MGERGDIRTTTLPTRLKQKSPVRGWRTTHNHATYKTRTQVTDEEGRRGDINTTALPIRLKHKLPIRAQGLEQKSPIKKGVTYIQPPCLQNSNASRQSGRGRTTHNRPVYNTPTIRRSGAGDDYTQLPSLQDSNTSGRSGRGAGVTYTQPTCLHDLNTSRRSGKGEEVTYTPTPCLQNSNTIFRTGRG